MLEIRDAEIYRRSHRCACGGSLFIQADPDDEFRTGTLECLLCSRTAATVRIKQPKPLPMFVRERAGRPPVEREPRDCGHCGKPLNREQLKRDTRFCSMKCWTASQPRSGGKFS